MQTFLDSKGLARAKNLEGLNTAVNNIEAEGKNIVSGTVTHGCAEDHMKVMKAADS